MAIQKLIENVAIVQTLSDYPNQEDGLSAQELKEKFDHGAKVIKEYVNDTLVPAVEGIEKKLEALPKYEVDATLSIEGKAADAAAVGNALKEIKAGIDASDYYHTEREVFDSKIVVDGVEQDVFDARGAAHVYKLYDGLLEEYPDFVKRNTIEGFYEDEQGEMQPAYEYVISCHTNGHYATASSIDTDAQKPKYLVLTGIHGSERPAVLSAYRFIRDVLRGNNVPKAFRDGAVIHVLPVANPLGFKEFTYDKPNGISIARNFNWNWEKATDDPATDYDESNHYGSSAESEPETKAISEWFRTNSDATAYIEFHNSGILNENVMLASVRDSEDSDAAKRAAMRGVDRVIPYWRDVIGYPPVETPVDNGDGSFRLEELPVIFSYAVTFSSNGVSYGYAQHEIGIPSITMETSAYYGDFTDWYYGYGRKVYHEEAIAMGAEALGNILIELFTEASEVREMSEVGKKLDELIGDDMVKVNGKLDTLMASFNQSLTFRVESGTLKITDVSECYDDIAQKYVIRIPCTKGAKLVAVYPDDQTLADILASKTTGCFCSFIGNFFAPDAGIELEGTKGCSYMTGLQPHPNDASRYVFVPVNAYVHASNTPESDEYGVTIPKLPALLAGRYEWVAYYWDDLWTGGNY